MPYTGHTNSQHDVEVTKHALTELCQDYLNDSLSQHSLSRRAKALTSSGIYNLSLLLKRAEVTVGHHICGFWNECVSDCQYTSSSLPWEEDVAMFKTFKVHLVGQRKRLVNQPIEDFKQELLQAHRIAQLERDLAKMQDSVGHLQAQCITERASHASLVEHTTSLAKRIDTLFEIPAIPPSSPQMSRSTSQAPERVPPDGPAFSHLPIIDLSRSPADISFAISAACRHVGFFYVINHGISSTLVAETYQLARDFFRQPKHVKQQVRMSQSRSGIRGYFSLGEEALNSDTAPSGDYKEGFDFGREYLSAAERSQCPLVDTNQWPQEALPAFQAGCLAYQNACFGLATTLMEAFATGLGAPETTFTQHATTSPMATTRLLHYPATVSAPSEVGTASPSSGKPCLTTPQPQLPKPPTSCGAHTDYGLFTLLSQDAIGGLQVCNTQGDWIDVPPIPGAFVVNIGDMLSQWTNGTYKSTLHRVQNTSGSERYSIPFFMNPNAGTLIEVLPTCRSGGGEVTPNEEVVPEHSEVILMKRYRKAFSHVKTTTTA